MPPAPGPAATAPLLVSAQTSLALHYTSANCALCLSHLMQHVFETQPCCYMITDCFLWINEKYSIARVFHSLLTHLSVDGYLGCFQFGIIRNKAAVDIHKQSSPYSFYFYFHLGHFNACCFVNGHHHNPTLPRTVGHSIHKQSSGAPENSNFAKWAYLCPRLHKKNRKMTGLSVDPAWDSLSVGYTVWQMLIWT